jgi:threonine dehydrogenase-like Zn-dependent dehydrogenase
MYGKHEEKLKLASLAKVETYKIHGDERDQHRLRDSFALVVEATGSPSGLRLAQEMTEPRGTIALKSTFHGTAPVETWPTVVKELSIIGSRCGPFDKAIGLLRSGKVDPTPLVTKTLPLAEAPKAIQFAQKPGVMKVLLKPSGKIA